MTASPSLADGVPIDVQRLIETRLLVQANSEFLATVEVRGPIPVRFEILQDNLGIWTLRSTMEVPDRAVGGATDIIFQNVLPGPEFSKRDVIVARVLPSGGARR